MVNGIIAKFILSVDFTGLRTNQAQHRAPSPRGRSIPLRGDISWRRNMFERYTQAARGTIFGARYLTSQVGSPEIETEHLLLGVLRADKCLANRFLGSPWAAETVWKRVEQRKPIRDKVPGAREIPLDKASQRALNLAAEEADQLSSRRIGTEHLLLGLLREEKGLAAKILLNSVFAWSPLAQSFRECRMMIPSEKSL